MADSYVCSTATLKCSFGDCTAKLTVYPDRTVFLTGQSMANTSDHVSMYNIHPFGKCRTTSFPPTGSATSANNGCLTPMSCIPGTDTEWLNAKKDYRIKGKCALLSSSYCKCKYGGIITIIHDGQTPNGIVDLEQENCVDQDQIEESQKLTTDQVLDGIQLALDVAGFIPGVGAFADLTNAAISACRGDWVGAGMSLVAAVPGIGDAAAGAKLAHKGVKMAKATAATAGTGMIAVGLTQK